MNFQQASGFNVSSPLHCLHLGALTYLKLCISKSENNLIVTI